MGFLSLQAILPPGTVFTYAGSSAPTGYLSCDGSAVSRTTYSALFASIGVAHGSGDGTTTFNLPDYRGRFLRGVTGASASDPDAASRSAMNTGGNTANAVGSVQGHAFQTHSHLIHGAITTAGGAQAKFAYGNNGDTAGGGIDSTGASGGNSQATSNETRPVNAYVNYIIKF